MKLLFIVNPISGGVNKEPFLEKAEKLCHHYGISHFIFKTTGKSDKIKVLEHIDSFKPDKIVSVGGDGTTLFTATTLLNSHIPMGIIPLGSANGMAAELMVNLKPIEALKDIIMSDMVKGLDLLLVNNEHYGIHIGDFGLNASIVEAYEKDEKRGMATYAKYFIEELKKLKPFEVTIVANGEKVKSNVLMTAICNARKYGTGIPLNNISNPMDGKFEIVLTEQIDMASLIKAGLSKFDDKYIDNQSSRVISTSKAEIIFDQPRLLQLDGEVIQPYNNIKIDIIKSAVNFITNSNNPYV